MKELRENMRQIFEYDTNYKELELIVRVHLLYMYMYNYCTIRKQIPGWKSVICAAGMSLFNLTNKFW